MQLHTYLRYFFPSLTWRISTLKKELYLTFDDGPIPELTPWVLNLLTFYQAKATFFCVGENVRKYPEVFNQIKLHGHSIGNHTMNHLNGWKTPKDVYLKNVKKGNEFIHSNLFRPPYGKLRFTQLQELKKDFEIVMWDVLSSDYDRNHSGTDCFEHLKNNARNGSIIVFHDSIKAEQNLRIALPLTLDYFSKQGFVFKSIKSNHSLKFLSGD